MQDPDDLEGNASDLDGLTHQRRRNLATQGLRKVEAQHRNPAPALHLSLIEEATRLEAVVVHVEVRRPHPLDLRVGVPPQVGHLEPR